ncbi:MAG TPA: IPT/TIG domain-containing protein [Polyangiales bacterium]
MIVASNARARQLLGTALLLMAAGCSHKTAYRPPVLHNEDAGAAGSAGSGSPNFPITGINSGKLTLTGVEPAVGPFSGGTSAVVRGSGFDDSAVVRVGGIAVQPDDVTRDGTNRITIVVPAGAVGPADVTVTQGDDTVTLHDGFNYNALSVTPSKGSTAGGTLVDLNVSGATLSADSTVTFDGAACTQYSLQSPQHATCKTPPHAAATVDVVVKPAADASTDTSLIAQMAFEYSETIDAANGGLSGGPINGTLNVTVVDYDAGNVIANAFVLVGNDPKSPLQGLTDARGAITFSTNNLQGPVTVHASAKCYERASIVSFDAQNVTIFLSGTLDPSCAAQGAGGSTRKELAATVSGQLIFPGGQEFAVNNWNIIPKPKAKEIRVAYVFTTQASLDAPNPDPGSSGAEMSRLVEGTATAGDHGFLYRIVARPAGLAVYALAGIERLDTQVFTPYVMGVAHNVVTSPGDEATDVDMMMNITLDRELDVSLSGYPAPAAIASDGPSVFRVRAYVDLGGEGLIVRNVNNQTLDMLTSNSGSEPFRFIGQPAFVGGLADASYYVLAGDYTPNVDQPFTSQKRSGVLQSSSPLSFTDFIGIPQTAAPAENGETIPADRTLRFTLDGADPDLITVDIVGGDGQPAWTQILPGNAREVPIPDLSSIQGQTDIAPGFIQWTVTAAKIDNFDYNQFQYTYLSSRYWTHTAVNQFFARH